MRTNSKVSSMINDVMEGSSPEDVVEQYSPGLGKAMDRIPKKAIQCPHCGLNIPTYPGRYPKHCPECDTIIKIKEADDSATYTQADAKYVGFSENPDTTCSNCENVLGSDRCSVVEGVINSGGHCNYWK